MITPEFVQSVDEALASLELTQPILGRLRRVPMDVIADAVGRGLPDVRFVKVWKPFVLQGVLVKIAIRNRVILEKQLHVLEE